MSGLRKAGLILIVVCLVGVVANGAAASVFPDRWGGPNIGAGMLQLLFLFGLLTGAALVVADILSRRHRP